MGLLRKSVTRDIGDGGGGPRCANPEGYKKRGSGHHEDEEKAHNTDDYMMGTSWGAWEDNTSAEGCRRYCKPQIHQAGHCPASV